MPQYEYICDDDQSKMLITKDFTDESIPECPVCKKEMRKVFYATPTIFNARGFYKTGG